MQSSGYWNEDVRLSDLPGVGRVFVFGYAEFQGLRQFDLACSSVF
jgi:hypothetical protein